MKLKGIVTGLAALLFLSVLASCIQTDYTLGTKLVPESQDITIHTATLDLPVGLKMADSLQTSLSGSATVGSIRSRTFGLIHSDAAFSVTAAYDSIVWGANPSVRSIYLTLVRDTTVTVDGSQASIPQNIYVHQLAVELDSTMKYNNSLTAADYNPEVLSVGGTVYFGGETYQIFLKEEIGRRLFEIPMETLDSAELFMKAFHGFYLRCDDPQEPLEGGRLNMFDLSSSYLYLNYDYTDDEGHRRSTTTAFKLGDYFTDNVVTAGSRPLENADPADALYMEGLCGIKPHVDAAALRETVTRWAAVQGIPAKNLLIAKATLSFPFEYDADHPDLLDGYSVNLYPCTRVRNENTGLVYYSPIDEINQSEMENGAIDRARLQYTSNVSLYLQDILDRDAADLTADDDLWLMPIVSSYNSSTGVTYYYADSYYYTQSFLNGTAATRHPVLSLTYSVLK